MPIFVLFAKVLTFAFVVRAVVFMIKWTFLISFYLALFSAFIYFVTNVVNFILRIYSYLQYFINSINSSMYDNCLAIVLTALGITDFLAMNLPYLYITVVVILGIKLAKISYFAYNVLVNIVKAI
ncbi:hypothetical protein AGMMS50229_06900 [Campylobacterota bacterium]|nr:hypothetical protein AGMMS50229_06900 [Campylobacterota bacterium]